MKKFFAKRAEIATREAQLTPDENAVGSADGSITNPISTPRLDYRVIPVTIVCIQMSKSLININSGLRALL